MTSSKRVGQTGKGADGVGEKNRGREEQASEKKREKKRELQREGGKRRGEAERLGT